MGCWRTRRCAFFLLSLPFSPAPPPHFRLCLTLNSLVTNPSHCHHPHTQISRFLHPPFLDPRTGLFNYRAFCATLRVVEPDEDEGGATSAAGQY